MEGEKTSYNEAGSNQSLQSVEEIMQIIQEAKTPGEQASKTEGHVAAGSLDPEDDAEFDLESEIDSSCDFLPPIWGIE